MDFNKMVKRIKNCYEERFDTIEEYNEELEDIHSDLYNEYGAFSEDIFNEVKDTISGSYRNFTEFTCLTFEEYVAQYCLEGKSDDAIEIWDEFMDYLSADNRKDFVMHNYVKHEEGHFQVYKGEYVIVCYF